MNSKKMKKEEENRDKITEALDEANALIKTKAAEYDAKEGHTPEQFRDAMLDVGFTYMHEILSKYNIENDDLIKLHVVPSEIFIRGIKAWLTLKNQNAIKKAFGDMERGDLQRDELYMRLWWAMKHPDPTTNVEEDEKYWMCQLYTKGLSYNALARIFQRSTRTTQKCIQHAIADGYLEATDVAAEAVG